MANATKDLNSGPEPQRTPDEPAQSATADLQALLFEIDTPSLGRGSAADGGERIVANANASSSPAATSADSNPADAEAAPELTLEEEALDAQLLVLADSPLVPDSDAASLIPDPPTPESAAEPNLSTRQQTHVAEAAWFDNTLAVLGEADAAIDPRARVAWRFKAATAAYKLLGPLATQPDRAELVTALRKYETALRAAGGTPPAGAKQVSDALHAQLSKSATEDLDRQLTKIEDKLLSIDECIGDDAFRMRWNKERENPKGLLRYARLLATRRFNVGYRRDRFEALAQELLTGKLPNGALALMPRGKAGPILRQVLRGLPRAATSLADRSAAITYLRDALDRLRNLNGAKQFFDSGFFLDVHGYKVSMHDQITNPEFLYLCVAVNVEIQNRLHGWSAKATSDGARSGSGTGNSAPPLATLQAQLRAQEQQVQGVFANFRKPISSSAPASAPAKKQTKAKRRVVSERTTLVPLVAAAVLLLGVVAVNLYVTGVVQLEKPPTPIAQSELQELSPLLLRASLNPERTQLWGLVSRPAWMRMDARARRASAELLADKLKQLGVARAQLFAYKTRAIEIDFNSVVYVDETALATQSH